MNFIFTQMSEYNDTPYSKIMVNSIRKHMPFSNIIQMSDRFAKPVPGANSVIKGEYDYHKDTLPSVWFQYMMAVKPNEMVHIDTDMIVMNSIEEIMDGDFDVAICKRGTDDEISLAYRIFHPYNIGIVATKTRAFWELCSGTLETWFKSHTWDLPQHVIGLVVNSGVFKVKFLDGDIYNRMPKNPDDRDDNVKIWHFKGGRKDWMTKWPH